MRFLANPSDVNWGGNAHGGIVMRWLTECAQALSTSFVGQPTVCVYTGGVHFHGPVHIGDVVEVDGRIIHTGPHSVHISLRVRSANPRDLKFRLTTRCTMIFVHINEHRKASEVPQLELKSEEDRLLDTHALDLIARRERLPRLPLPRR